MSRPPHDLRPCRRRWARVAIAFLALPALLALRAAGLDDVRQALRTGQYSNAVQQAEAGWREHPESEDWQLVAVEAWMTTGRYAEAYGVVTNALAKESRSLRLRWLARDVFCLNNQPARAAEMVKDITEFVGARPWAYREAPDLVVFGQAALAAGADPKRVIDRVFDNVKKADPNLRDTYLATGELALDKHDYALAAKTFQEGLKKRPDDPDLQCGLARAYLGSEPALAQTALEAALKTNTNHIPSLLLLADRAIDAEAYDEAQELLTHVLGINPAHPEAWTYRAVLARLQNQPEREREAVAAATRCWPGNPKVPHLFGRKLSQDYRFAEGATLQREALKLEPAYLPAKAQLAQDLLRLGEDDEGWRLAQEVHDKDGYDVTALNLVTLRDTMARYATVTNVHFVVHLTPKESALYGARVLELLESARTRLSARYGFAPERPVRVEMFADQKDFAVRTFGMPENHGFLGVCFGPVITANSPASRPGQAFNWEAMLWHEFCHVITLQLTRNKMPRWLSEGISVYEERQASPAWGERIGARYREMILGDDLTPVGRLSRAFMSPPSAVHLQFAYYQCSLVVEFIVERFGFEKLVAILRDLGEGTAINDALARATVPLPQLERDFTAFARQKALALGPTLGWEKPDAPADGKPGISVDWASWSRAHPTNFYVLSRQAAEMTEEKRWTDARAVLERLVTALPDVYGGRDAYAMLATTHRSLGDTNAERQVLLRLAERDDKTVTAYQRLMELGASMADWPVVLTNAARYLAVNPLVPVPHRFLAQAGEATGNGPLAIAAYRALLELDPANPAEVHYRLARQLKQAGDPEARRQVILALEEAPRYRDALRLLLELQGSAPAPAAAGSAGGGRP